MLLREMAEAVQEELNSDDSFIRDGSMDEEEHKMAEEENREMEEEYYLRK